MIQKLRNRLRYFLNKKDDNDTPSFDQDTYSKAYSEAVDEIEGELNTEKEMTVTLEEIEKRMNEGNPLTDEQSKILSTARLN